LRLSSQSGGDIIVLAELSPLYTQTQTQTFLPPKYQNSKHQEVITMTSQQTTMKMEQADFLVCQHILSEFKRPKHRKYVRSFIEPVNIVAVPTYLNVIRQPMDLSTIAFKLGKDIYDNALTFRADFELMLDNSDTFNAGHPPSPVFEQGIQLREEFNLVWADHHNWLERVHPHIFNKPHPEEDKENMDEPPTKKRRQSSRLIAISPTEQSPYTAAKVVRKSTSNPTTPVPGASKKPLQERTSLPAASRADSVSSPAKQGTTIQATAIRRAESVASELTEIDLPAPQAEEPMVTATQTTSRPSGDQTHNRVPIKTA
jgi:hypothetical protein